MNLQDLTEASNVAWLKARREYLAAHINDRSEELLRAAFSIGFAMGGKYGASTALDRAGTLAEGIILAEGIMRSMGESKP